MVQKRDEYLEKLKEIDAEMQGIEMRVNALENGYVADTEEVDRFLDNIKSKDPVSFDYFLPQSELDRIIKEYDQELNKGPDCDVIDYAMAACCGVLCGTIDVIFASDPHKSVLSGKVDDMYDNAIMLFAKKTGWDPKDEKKGNVASAIGFLENYFKIDYDQAKSHDIDNKIKHMSPKNHHAKSAGHYPDMFGLIASICNQFTGTSSFYDTNKGNVVYVTSSNNDTILEGEGLIGKIFAGTANWFGHCISDIGGSSGSRGKGEGHVGSGLPIPMTEFFQMCSFDMFKNEKGQSQSFGTVMTRVFEEGYDTRHATAMSVPVILCELIIRMIYVIRKHFIEGLEWMKSLPGRNNFTVNRMLTTGIGSMCIVDLGHATVASWGNWVAFFSKLNLISWSRFGVLCVNELKMRTHREIYSIERVQDQISDEWDRLLEESKDLLDDI